MSATHPPLPLHLTLPQALRQHAQLHPGAVALRQKEHGIWKPIAWSDYHRRALHVG